MIEAKVSIASCVRSRAAVITSRNILIVPIMVSRFGRPVGFPLWPGRKLVDRHPPRDISPAFACSVACFSKRFVCFKSTPTLHLTTAETERGMNF
jgi:hypothetical protein